MMNHSVVNLEDSLSSVNSSNEGENVRVVNLEDSLSSLSLYNNGAEDDYLDNYPTLHSVLFYDDDNLVESSSSHVPPIRSEFSRSQTATVRPISQSNQINSEFATVSVTDGTKTINSSKVTPTKNRSSNHSLDSKALLQNAFNKKLYLPKGHEFPSRRGARALSVFCHHKDEMIKTLQNLRSSLKNCPSDDSTTEQPSGLAITLFDYQLKGLLWLLWRESESPPGGIVADDMGLGKTIQMISLILKSKELSQSQTAVNILSSRPIVMGMSSSQTVGGTLIVVPSCVLGQWSSEINKRVKPRYLTVCIYHGQSRAKSIHTLARFSVVLTTYGTLQKSSEVDPLKRVTWERIILDEAHLIRNHRSQTAKSVFTLKGLRKWALTGTPIQNKCHDYYALMNFLQLKPFNDLAVWKKFVDNKHDSGFQRLGIISKAILIRRTKEQIKNASVIFCIGEKRVENVLIELDKEEFVVYEKLSHFSKALLVQFIQEQTRRELENRSERNDMKLEFVGENQDIDRWRKNFESMEEVKTLQILTLLLRLRQLCCHPSLTRATLMNSEFEKDAIGGFENRRDQDATSTGMPESLYGHDAILDDSPLFHEDRMSSKINAVIGLLRRIFQHSNTDKVIIVSQWTSFLSLIEKFVMDHLNMKCASFNGKIAATKRQPIVDEFNSGSAARRILLLSLTAGGIGLNLVGANHIIFTDLHWNPQLENQAADRIYRFGQTKDVYVYKIMCVCTIEERISRLQQTKISIANGILNGCTVGNTANKLSVNDLKLLFGLEGKEYQQTSASNRK